jgi:hypothetical protein
LTPILTIDDDIVYISDNAISDLVAYKLNHPEHLFASANIINHPRLQKLHNHFMVMRPFAAEQHHPSHETTDWRINHLPTSPLEEVKSFDDWPTPPEYKHRWLPMRGASSDDCPIRDGLACSGQPQWQCAAIAHYTFFQHLENSMPLN